MKIALAHDYFVQPGGAERVVGEWARHATTGPIYTLAWNRRALPSSIEEGRLVTPLRSLGGHTSANAVEIGLGALPGLTGRLKVDDDADAVLASSSAFMHGLRSPIPLIAYLHSPPRWLYAEDDYRLGLSAVRRAGLKALRPGLLGWDRRAAARAALFVANSKVTQARIKKAYGIDCPVVHPPVTCPAPVPERPRRALPEKFLLTVGRAKAYKATSLAVEAAQQANVPIVVVGPGSEHGDDPEGLVYGLGRVSDAELTYLYQHASALLALGSEDFGLTPLEANLQGVPVVAYAGGGFLETVVEGLNGVFVTRRDAATVAGAIDLVLRSDWQPEPIVEHAKTFSAERHWAALMDYVTDVAA